MPLSIEWLGRRGWQVGQNIYRTEEAAHAAVRRDQRERLRKRAILAAILEHRSIADAIVRARTSGRV